MTATDKPRTKRPPCLACGKPLKAFAKPDWALHERQRGKPQYQNSWHVMRVWVNQYSDYRDFDDGKVLATVDQEPATWGAFGDNAFCNVTCGWAYAVRALIAVGGVKEFDALMPDAWRASALEARATEQRRARDRQKRLMDKEWRCGKPVNRGACCYHKNHNGACETKGMRKRRIDAQIAAAPHEVRGTCVRCRHFGPLVAFANLCATCHHQLGTAP